MRPFFRQNAALARELWNSLRAPLPMSDRTGDVLLATAAGVA
jgi:hypothetical protein